MLGIVIMLGGFLAFAIYLAIKYQGKMELYKAESQLFSERYSQAANRRDEWIKTARKYRDRWLETSQAKQRAEAELGSSEELLTEAADTVTALMARLENNTQALEELNAKYLDECAYADEQARLASELKSACDYGTEYAEKYTPEKPQRVMLTFEEPEPEADAEGGE